MSWLKALAGGGLPARVADQYEGTWTSTNLNSWLTFQTSPAAGIRVDYESAITCATVYACSQAIATTLASMPAVVYEIAADDTKHKAKDSLFWRLLHQQPNRDMDAMQFFELMTTRALNRGNGYAWIERDNAGRPIALWPLHNSRVIPWWYTQEGRLEYHIYLDEKNPSNPWGYSYFRRGQNDVLNLVGFNSQNGIVAPGVIPTAREDISLDVAAQQYGASWFGNGARPGGLVKHPGFIKDATKREQFRMDLNKVHAGRENWNKVGVLWDGAEWQNVEVSPEQAQFLATRTMQAKTICRWYGVPPAVVQIFDDYKFSSVDAMLRQFVMLCLRSWAERWERAVERQLFQTLAEDDTLRQIYPGREFMFEFLMDSLLRGDPKMQAETDQILLQWGVINIDEARTERNLDPIPGGLGRQHFFPMNYAPLADASAGLNRREDKGKTNARAIHASQRRHGGVEKHSVGGPRFTKAIYRAVHLAAKSQTAAIDRLGTVIESRISIPPDRTLVQDLTADRCQAFSRRVLDEAVGRMVSVESNAVHRAAERPKDFLPRIERFYSKHQVVMAEAIELGLDGLLKASGFGGDTKPYAADAAARWCQASQESLLAAADGDPDQFLARVSAVLDAWASRRLDATQYLSGQETTDADLD